MPKLSFQYVRHAIPETLLEFLVRRFRYHSVLEWEERIRGGHVTVNGKQVMPGHLLETRHRIIYDRPPGPEPAVDARYRVLFEDEHVLAVSKSGNIPTSPSGKYWANCLVHMLQRERDLPGLRAVHRLDRETSGINLFAKHREAARTLGLDFQAGRVGKGYATILCGEFPRRGVYVSAPLRDARSGAVRIRQEVHPDGRPAQTRFVLRARLPAASLVQAEPLTGRTHQIRAHAALLGHPVCGDKLYGQSEEAFLAWVQGGERNGEERQLLHASELAFAHPYTGKRIELRDAERELVQLYLGKGEVR
ncbi:MAG TPA: RluA family pseudouridine synthase [bacterium]|nr:RluA family pseudouridine synthase [bacterium]